MGVSHFLSPASHLQIFLKPLLLQSAPRDADTPSCCRILPGVDLDHLKKQPESPPAYRYLPLHLQSIFRQLHNPSKALSSQQVFPERAEQGVFSTSANEGRVFWDLLTVLISVTLASCKIIVTKKRDDFFCCTSHLLQFCFLHRKLPVQSQGRGRRKQPNSQLRTRVLDVPLVKVAKQTKS